MEIPSYEGALHDLVLAVSSNNQLGDFIIDRYLNFSNPSICARLIAEIVLYNYDLLESRLLKLHNFILTNLDAKVAKLTPFLIKYSDIIQIISKDL